jgi:hypothetical protein
LAQEALAFNAPLNPEARKKNIDDLTMLYATADGILKVLSLERAPGSRHETQEKLTQALSNHESRLNLKLNHFAASLAQEKQVFVNVEDDAIFIDSASIQPTITQEADNGLIDAIVSKINLAILAADLRDQQKQKRAPESYVQDLNRVFPSAFVTSFARDRRIGSSKLFEETFQLGLDLRTLLAIQVLQQDGADEQLRDFFYEELPEQSAEARLTLFQGETQSNVNAHGEKLEAVELHLAELDKVFGSNYKKGGQKTKKYGWQPFVINTLMWIQNRNEELSYNLQQIGFSGGIGDLETLLSGGVPGVNHTTSAA